MTEIKRIKKQNRLDISSVEKTQTGLSNISIRRKKSKNICTNKSHNHKKGRIFNTHGMWYQLSLEQKCQINHRTHKKLNNIWSIKTTPCPTLLVLKNKKKSKKTDYKYCTCTGKIVTTGNRLGLFSDPFFFVFIEHNIHIDQEIRFGILTTNNEDSHRGAK